MITLVKDDPKHNSIRKETVQPKIVLERESQSFMKQLRFSSQPGVAQPLPPNPEHGAITPKTH